MAKSLRKVLISVIGAISLLLMGFLFVGCNEDYSDITISSDKAYVEIYANGDSESIVFTLDNYRDGYNNTIMLSFNGPANFEYTQNRISDNQIRVDITGKFGGSSKLVATTFESAKKCEVEIFVKKYSQTMSENKDTVLYLSNTTDFVPTVDNFIFDSDTTEKAVTYFYLDAEREIDSDYTLKKENADFANNKVRLTNQAFGVDAQITEFDKIVLRKTDDGNVPYLYLDGQEIRSIALQDKFFILCVYDYSIGDDYLAVAPNFLYTISSVNVLPSIDVKLSGGYEIGGNVEFSDVNETIVIVPNNQYKGNYVIKAEVYGTDVKMEKENSDNISFNEYNFQYDNQISDAPIVKYYKVSREHMTQVQGNASLHIYYDLAKEIEGDDSVNYLKSFDIEVKIAPKELLVNGTTTPEKYVLYNYYDETTVSSADYGWKELNLTVSSGISASPNFDYFFFEFGNEIKIENSLGESIKSGVRLYNIDETFFIRGTSRSNFTGESNINIYLVSDVLESANDDRISITVNCDIRAGANEILGGSNTEILYLDYYGEKHLIFGKLYADHPFESISVVYESGTGNVVDFETGSYINDGTSTDFFLDIKVSPKAVGQGRYTIYLDNGVYTQVIFEVVKTLNEQTTQMQLAGTGNDAVKYYNFYANENSEFENNLDLEILNASDSNSVTFGSRAIVNILSNAQSISQPEYDQNCLNVVNSGNSQINIVTTANGDETVLVTLVGYSVDSETFTRHDDKTLTLKINVSSYSLINDFSLTNSRGDARYNTIYYGEGNIQASDMQAEFEIVANNVNSKNFYHYFFVEEELAKMFDDATKVVGQDYYSYIANSNQYELRMSKEAFSTKGNKFIDFYASIKNSSGYAITTDTLTTVTITKFDGGTSTSKKIVLTLPSGIMFFAENMSFTVQNGNVTTNYTVQFTNEFQVGTGNYGVFNLDNMTYVNKDIASYDLVLEANLRQRDSSKQYTVSITATKYQSVENIYMMENITNIDFTSKKGQLSRTFSVITYPSVATNNSITVNIQNTSGYDFFEVIYKDQNGNFLKDGSGNFVVTISCEKFYRECQENGIDISTIDTQLKATVYIFPLDWGEVYTDPNVFANSPIAIDVQYRNGSRANPYLIENASDLMDINSNEETLKSHYEIKANIDMSSVDFDNYLPIGILQKGENYEMVGFSGTIVGTTSQAKISNVNLSNGVVLSENIGSGVVQSYYSGLFARLNAYYNQEKNVATMENLTISGSMNLNLTLPNLGESTAVTPNCYVGLLSGENLSLLKNVKAEINKSSVNVLNPSNSSYNVYVGGLVGANYGTILQDFTQYETKDNPEDYEHDFAGQSVKNLAYFNDFLTINSSDLIFAGGVAGATSGLIERQTSEKLKYYGYSAYSAYSLIKVESAYRAFVGGIAGVISNYAENGSYITNKFTLSDKVGLKNLLVGGEIDTTKIDNASVDYVGGVVGYIDSVKVKPIEILANETRVFLRACANVGAIAGYDVYNSSYGEEVYTIFENSSENSFNIISAIDDGRVCFYSSMIIKTRVESNLPVNVTNSFFAIGGFNGLDYSGYHFEAYSYLSRGAPLSGPIVAVSSQSKTSYYGDYIIVYNEDNDIKLQEAYTFKKGSVVMDYDKDNNPFMMSSDETTDVDVFFMYYFAVTGRLGSENASIQDEINDLNTVNVGSEFYPFAFSTSSNDIKITSSNTDVLTVDSNGNLTVLNSGRVAVLNLSSILNVNVTKTVYVYVVNFFNKDEMSMFYTGASLNSNPISSGSNVNIYGYNDTTINLVPSYELQNCKDVNGTKFSISKTGVLSYKNVSYQLRKNANLTVKDLTDKTSEDYFSTINIDAQTIIFLRKDGEVVNGEIDNYQIVPVLATPVTDENGNKFVFYYVLENASINLKLTYRDRATKIVSQTMGGYIVKTNEEFHDTITVTSSNDEDLLFYRITNKFGKVIQSRFPSKVDLNSIISDTEYDNLSEQLKPNYQSWSYYINSILDNKDTLFNLKFTRTGNVFNFTGMVNANSDLFKDRFKEDIFGDYVIEFFASELNAEGAPTLSYVVTLEESELSSFEIRNFSNKNNVTEPDQVIVPSKEGLLEIDLDPIEAVFDRFTISNDERNSNAGAGIASFQFAYRKYNAFSSVEYVKVPNFGTYVNGVYTFTYEDMITKLEEVIGKDNDFYVGKIFLIYTLPSINVEDGVSVRFNVSVKKLSGENENRHIDLTTKLESYAKLVFDAKKEQNGYYYLARGLSYKLHLESYGFDFATDSLEVSTNAENIVSFDKETFTLNVTNDIIFYPSDKAGYYVEVTTIAKKVVDNVNIITNHVLKIYVMEYVLNYMFTDGINEDIVYGMEDGAINITIGNPFEFRSNISEFIEFDSSISGVSQQVSKFVNDLTQNMTWNLFDVNDYPMGTQLTNGRKISNDYYVIDSFTFTALKEYHSQENVYYFECEGFYDINGGLYNASVNGLDKIKTRFVFNIRQQSTRNSPIPIRTYEDFIAMEDDGWYILLSDIDLHDSVYAQAHEGESQFMPITASIAGLDGNGFNINFSGEYDFDVSEIGIFAEIVEEAIISNVNIRISSDTTFNVTAQNFNIGLLASTNNGIVTNCQAESLNGASLIVNNIIDASSNYISGIVATNNAYLTHSRSKVNIRGNANIAGLVGINSSYGVITSSYYYGSSIINSTAVRNTAGFVVVNNGKIYTSYVSGVADKNSVFYEGTENRISSGYQISGFAYSNTGDIKDCYSNINLEHRGFFASGFVYENAGNIERCFSTSVLASNQASSFGFARSNKLESGSNGNETNGLIKNCYYLSDADYETPINVSIEKIPQDQFTDIKELQIKDFGNYSENVNGEVVYHDNISKYFGEYVVADGRDVNSVWFFNDNASDNANFNECEFNTGRIELVAANIIARSQRNLIGVSEVVGDEGAVSIVYSYAYSGNSYGSIYNPILINNAENFETLIASENSQITGLNEKYYRIISDIDYAEYSDVSRLNKTRFMGYMEGNFMSIKGITLTSGESLIYGGLFAEIGGANNNSVGTVMNLTVLPKVVSFSNARVVGTLAGKVDSGTLVNINILTDSSFVDNDLGENQNINVSGLNIVGGVAGLALGDYKFQNVYSSVDAVARNQSIILNEFNSSSTDYTSYSFAGSIFGVLSGNGKTINTVKDTVVSVLGAKAGLMFGLIDRNAYVDKVTLKMLDANVVNAYNYGGLVCGESKGNVSNVEIIGSGTYFKNFSTMPYTANAIGGFAGLVSGGVLNNVKTTQSIAVSTISASKGFGSLGGIAGLINASVALNDIYVKADIIGYCYVGGIAGSINTSGNATLTLENIDVLSNLQVGGLYEQEGEVGVGGLAGSVSRNVNIFMSTSDEQRRNKFEITSLGTDIVPNFGIYVGVYSNTVKAYLGAIIGFDNGASYSFENVDSSIIGKVNVVDRGVASSDVTITLKSTDDALNDSYGDLEIPKSQYITESISPADNSVCFCDITFTRPEQGGSNYILFANFFGSTTGTAIEFDHLF